MIGALISPLVVMGGNAMAVDIFSNCGANNASSTVPSVCSDASSQKGNNGKNNPIINVLKQAINIISFIIGIGAVIGIVVSGVRMIISGGNGEAVASARTSLLYSLAGLAVAVIAQALVAFVLSKVG